MFGNFIRGGRFSTAARRLDFSDAFTKPTTTASLRLAKRIKAERKRRGIRMKVKS